jgi:hypothetical protein
VYPGTYKEKLTISKNDITLKGSAYPSTNPADNDAELIYATYASAVGSNDASATLLITGSGFKMYNMVPCPLLPFPSTPRLTDSRMLPTPLETFLKPSLSHPQAQTTVSTPVG